jgi:pectate lyase
MVPAAWAQGGLKAFPGAEGFGAYATGGRWGSVVEVTNLNDAGPGSLREALMATGPRIVVFRVGGTIELASRIRLGAAQSDLTYAGQTAPGDGITLRLEFGRGIEGKSPIVIDRDARNMIFRSLRSRAGPSAVANENNRALTVNGQNIIIDHCSLTWSMDEVVNTWYTAGNVTFQWCIIGEALDYSNHEEGRHGVNFLAGDNVTSISLHHNLMVKGDFRQPRLKVQEGQIVNNVFYNSGSQNSKIDNKDQKGPARYDYVGNRTIKGPDSSFRDSLVVDDVTRSGIVTAYVKGNIDHRRTNDSQAEGLVVSSSSKKYLVSTPHNFPPVTTTSADEAYDQVLAHAGAIFPYRDAVDQRLIAEVKARRGKIIDAPGETTCVGLCQLHHVVLEPSDYTQYGITDPLDADGWPILKSGIPPTDTDHDGMPDSWETSRDLNPNDPADRNNTAPSGYTQIEEYINGLIPPPGG